MTNPSSDAEWAELVGRHGWALTPLMRSTPGFAARLTGVDAGGELGQAQVDTLRAVFDAFAVVHLPGQRLDDEQQTRFGQRFGEIETVPTAVDQERRRLSNSQINDISNLGADGQLLAQDDRRRMYNLGNLLWHSDSSFKTVPAAYSMLHARVIPQEGGNTEFADMRAAWDDLPAEQKEQVRDLVCEHSVIFSRAQLGFESFSPAEVERCRPVRQRLVRTHPATGRASLYLSAHIGRIEGWLTPEALALIRELTEFATQRRYVHAHVWQVGDLVVWDNRSTMHRGRPYASNRYPRDLRRVTIAGERSTMDEPVATVVAERAA